MPSELEKKELISILMPAYQAQETILDSVQSVLDQTYTNWELVISSDDGTDYEKLLHSQGIIDSRIVYVSTGKVASGPANARNVALDRARENIIAVLDADDLFSPEKLARSYPFVQEHGFIMTGMHVVHKTPEGFFTTLTNTGQVGSRCISTREYGFINYTAFSLCIFDKRRIPIRWRPNLPVVEDLMFGFEAYDHLSHIFFIDEPLHWYIQRDNSLSHSDQAYEQFKKTKTQLLNLLKKKPFLQSPHVIQALEDFLTLSLEVEILNSEKKEDVDFIKTFQEVCHQRGISLPLRTFDPPQLLKKIM